jgi:hypothetical protein
MKKVMAGLVGFAVVCLVVSMAMAGAPTGKKPYSVNVGATSTLLLAGPGLYQTNAIVWTNLTAATVDQVYSCTGRYYQVTVAGTFEASAPTHTDGVATNGGTSLRYIHAARAGYKIMNLATGKVFVAYGNAAETNKGFCLMPAAATVLEAVGTVWQGNIYGIAESTTTNAVMVHEE